MICRYLIVFLVLVFNISCNKIPLEEISDSPTEKYPGVDTAIWPYFSTFEKEASLRGLEVDLAGSGISAEFSDLMEDHVAGQCIYNYLDPGSITIDHLFWAESNQLDRELVIFHELGHCYLNRDHLDEAFSNGICRSIMRSGTCCCQDAYNERNRNYYLDELFGVPESL